MDLSYTSLCEVKAESQPPSSFLGLLAPVRSSETTLCFFCLYHFSLKQFSSRTLLPLFPYIFEIFAFQPKSLQCLNQNGPIINLQSVWQCNNWVLLYKHVSCKEICFEWNHMHMLMGNIFHTSAFLPFFVFVSILINSFLLKLLWWDHTADFFKL